MPDKTTRVETDSNSGAMKVVMPNQPPKQPPTDTHVEVEPGTHEHTVTVEDVQREPERRRQQAPVAVNVQQPPNSGGLVGAWASVANLSAVGAFLLLTFLMYRDFVANVRERDTLIREEMRQTRSSDQSSQAAMVAALGALTTKMDALAISNNTMAASNASIISEFRVAQQEMRSLVRMLAKDKGLPPPEPEMGTAPLPRVKASGG